MTPFVDIAFLILSFFIMATKFKPQENIEIKTPNSVLSQELPDANAVMISIDSANRVYYSLLSEKEPEKFDALIDQLNSTQHLNLDATDKAHFRKTYMVGVPFANLKSILDMDPDAAGKVVQPGIPVMDTLNNQLTWWVKLTKDAFAGETLRFLIKGDGVSKYPAFEAVIDALKKNEEFKYDLITSLEDVPPGTELYKIQKQQKSK